jgi:hypothetical protein
LKNGPRDVPPRINRQDMACCMDFIDLVPLLFLYFFTLSAILQ